MDIGRAVEYLRGGARVERPGWNGKGMWLALQEPDAHSRMTLPYVYMHTAQGDLVPWLCSQTDLLATDWELVDAGDPKTKPDFKRVPTPATRLPGAPKPATAPPLTPKPPTPSPFVTTADPTLFEKLPPLVPPPPPSPDDTPQGAPV